MSVRQYIGARYVPRFSDVNNGIWSNVYSYEPLTIVKNGNDYYTSKKSVPVGVAITNTEYWVKTGDYNGAIADLDARASSLDTRVSSLDTRVSSLDTRVSSLDTRVDALEENYYILVGDSYADPTVVSPTWQDVFQQKMNLDNDHCIKAYKGGYGVYPPYDAYAYNLLTPGVVDTGVPSTVDGSKITKIIVAMGFNDRASTVQNVLNGMAQIKRVKDQYYPNAQVYLCNIGFSWNTEFIVEISNEIASKAYSQAENYNFVYIPFGKAIMHNYSLFKAEVNTAVEGGLQYVHPNATGSTKIGNSLANFMKSGTLGLQYDYIVQPLTVDAQFSAPATVNMACELTENMTYVNGSGSIRFESESPISVPSTIAFDIPLGKFNGAGYVKSARDLNLGSVAGFISGGTQTDNTPFVGLLIAKSGGLYIRIFGTPWRLTGTFSIMYIQMSTTAIVPSDFA